MSIHTSFRFKFLQLVRLNRKLNNNFRFSVQCSTSTGIYNLKLYIGNYQAPKKKLDNYFFDKEVQSILRKITGLNYDKVFQPKKQEITREKFKFVTDKELKEMFDEANAKAAVKLQMPPVMDIREPINEVLSKDPELQYYLQAKLVFIDTSPNRTSRNRIITVREMDGTLRKADWDERFRMNQIFYPLEGRSLETPKFFESTYLEKLLDEESYEFVLDSACVQFEPDDPEYHRVTHSTYEHIKNHKKFDVLRSTRHFGPMAFYFAVTKDIDSLLVDMIERQLIDDAADTIKLLHIINPDLEMLNKEMDSLECVQDYIQRNKSAKTAHLELALQSFVEVQLKDNQANTSL